MFARLIRYANGISIEQIGGQSDQEELFPNQLFPVCVFNDIPYRYRREYGTVVEHAEFVKSDKKDILIGLKLIWFNGGAQKEGDDDIYLMVNDQIQISHPVYSSQVIKLQVTDSFIASELPGNISVVIGRIEG